MTHNSGALRRGLRRIFGGSEEAASAPAAQAFTAPGIVLTEEFTRALSLLETGRHVFITGKAGTGKSTLVRHFMANTTRNVVVAAPTGIAALNVDGYTIHRLFSFTPRTTLEEVASGRYYPRRFAETLREVDTLIIDEASMVRADLFDLLEAALRRFGPRRGAPFGGVQLVLVGDLFQLPPVVPPAERDHFTSRYDSPYFFAADSYAPADFPVVALTHVFRQQGDAALVDVLNAVRTGALLDDARALLNTRTNPDFEPPLDDMWLTLTTTNRIATARNRRMLDRLPGPVHTFAADLTGETDEFDPPAEEQLHLAAGAQVMLLNNAPGGQWVNGTIGRVEEVRNDPDGEPVLLVRDQAGDLLYVRRHTWEITRPVAEGGSLRHEVVGTYTQLPLKLAWAITIHKSQGQTLPKVVVDLSGGTFATGQLYVALSRCTSMDGLVLHRDVLPKDLRSDLRVRRFLADHAEQTPTRGHAYLGMLTVGGEDRMSRPRPIELAVVTDEGEEFSTLINPTSDLYEARTLYDITVADIQFAPLLTEAWSALGHVLQGRVPVVPNVDHMHGLIDFELKRLGHVTPLPTGLSIDVQHLTAAETAAFNAPTALARARAARDAALRLRMNQRRGGEPFTGSETTSGYLLTRAGWPASLAAHPAHSDPASALAEHLRVAAARIHLDAGALERLRLAEEYLEMKILDEARAAAATTDPTEHLQPGARICFTGSMLDASGVALSREQAEVLATQAGFVPVKNVTKTKCDVLVVAEAGTQSGKAKKALEYGKPILTAEEFLAHVVP